MATTTTRPPAGLTRRDVERLRFARWRYRRGDLNDGEGYPRRRDFDALPCHVCNPDGRRRGDTACPCCFGSGWMKRWLMEVR